MSTHLTLILVDDEPRVSSEMIAEHAAIEHRAVLQILGQYEADFADFGGVAFEMRTLQTAGGPQKRRVAMLNEDQATLLLTYLKNTEQVRGFKKSLVRAFREARSAAPAAPALTEDEIVHQALQITAAKVEALTARVAELEQPARAWDHLASASGDYSVNEAAKTLSRDHSVLTGERRLFAQMQRWGWIYRQGGDWRPYQAQVDNGRLATRARSHHHPRTGELIADAPQIRVTTKGLGEMLRLLTEAAS